MERHWKIEELNSDVCVFERLIPEGSLTESEIETLLQRLACRHLSESEILASSLRHNSSGYIDHLAVAKNKDGRFGLYTHGNPMYTARIIESE